jgi:predicted O-methyltransferase YrrM
MTTYAIRGGIEGKRRLDLLAQVMAPTIQALLARAGLRPGMRCLDLGCGGGHVSRLLAQMVGQSGRVVGLDLDQVKLESAQEHCRSEGLENVEFRQVDVTEWSEPETYDLVYGRFILSHLGGRPAVVARMAEALRPGGVVVLEDIDFTGSFCYPPNSAYDRYCELYRAVIRRRGGDADLGPQLYGLCLDAGMREGEVRTAQPIHTGKQMEKTLSLSTLINIADAVLAERLATASELDATIAALTQYTDDPRSIIGFPRIFQVWAQRPN